MTPLYTVADTRAIEARMFESMPSFTLMQQAGAAVAAAAEAMLSDKNAGVLAIAGAGNNGGDATIAATRLRQAGIRVQLLLCGEAEQLPADAAAALRQWQAGGSNYLTPATISNEGSATMELPPADLIIDGLFGIGLSRPPQGIWRQLIDAINRHPAAVLAIDVPSGLSADSGEVLETAIQAARTVTFFGGKSGLYTGDGGERSGMVEIADLEAPPHPPSGLLMNALLSGERLRRRKNSHKGSYKTLALIGGAGGMLGALVLAARAAATLGAGKTIAFAMDHCPAVDWRRPDIMWREAAAFSADDVDCIAAGMGLGLGDAARQCLLALLPLPLPLLLDADALTLLAQHTAAAQPLLRARRTATILTPHPAEAARLLGCSTRAVNRDRIAAARELAEQWNAVVVLKGAGSIIYARGQPFIICAAGNPGLARGGSGDVLSGIIAALLAQSGEGEFAAANGVYLHAAAADQLAAATGEIGVDINELAATAARLLKPAD